jgi:acyl carrier protein
VNDVPARVLALVVSIAGRPEIDPAARWQALGMDSLDLLSLVTAVEDEFGIAIPDPVAMRLRCVSDVVELVSSDQLGDGGEG